MKKATKVLKSKKSQKYGYVEEAVDMSKVRVSEFKGYCPKCHMMITSLEMVSKKVYECMGCGSRGDINKLITKVGRSSEMSFKEYMEDIVEVNDFTGVIKVEEKAGVNETGGDDEVIEGI